MTISEQLNVLETRLKTKHVSVITHNATEVKPGKVTVLIQPPEITSEQWGESDAKWVAAITAGTPTTQGKAVIDILTVLDEWTASGININEATPATFNLAEAGSLGCYEVTLGPMDL